MNAPQKRLREERDAKQRERDEQTRSKLLEANRRQPALHVTPQDERMHGEDRCADQSSIHFLDESQSGIISRVEGGQGRGGGNVGRHNTSRMGYVLRPNYYLQETGDVEGTSETAVTVIKG